MEAELWGDESVQHLVRAVLLLEREEDAKAFLRDILTKSELQEISRRWQAARMLHQKVPYVEIEEATGLSSTTIARISKWLQQGAGGYRMMLEKFGE